MKSVMLIFCLLPFHAMAVDNCGSVWIWKSYNSCAHVANGLDKTQGQPQATMNLWSQWQGGGADQASVCREVASQFSNENILTGLVGEVARSTPIAEKSDVINTQRKYQYQCAINVTKYPVRTAPNAACGADSKISTQVGGSSQGLSGEGLTCLSCENLADQNPSAMAACLKANIAKIMNVNPAPIDLREPDFQAVSKQVSMLLKLNKHTNIKGLETPAELLPFVDFIESHPVTTQSPNGPTSGGSLPTLQ